MSERLSVCEAIAAMIRDHGEPGEAEVNFVAAAAIELGLDVRENEKVQHVLRAGGNYRAALGEVKSRPLRGFLFRRIVAATLIDDHIEDDELAAINAAATAFGFDQRLVTEYVEWMKEGIRWERRGAELLGKLMPTTGEPPAPPPFAG